MFAYIRPTQTINQMKRKLFTEDEIPYGTLARFGLNREMIHDLPKEITDDMMDGHRTPALPISYLNQDTGNTVRCRTRLALTRKPDGHVDVVFFPELEDCDMSGFSEKDRESLGKGKVIMTDYTMSGGQTVKAYVQLDRELNQVVAVPTPVIGRNLQVCAENLGLDADDLRCIQHGATVSMIMGEGVVTMGLDLNSRSGIRFCNGDTEKWNREAGRIGARYNFGINGCWVQGDDGRLEYVPEDKYTDEIIRSRSSEIRESAGIRR